MNNSISTDSREQGFVLVLALFMLTICTIIGMAAMSTSTTELDISGNERVHKETFYQAEAGSSAAAEALLDKEAYDTWTDNDKFADLGLNGYIQIPDGSFLLEPKDVDPWPGNIWKKDHPFQDTVEKAPDMVLELTISLMLMWMWIKSMSAILPEAVQSSAQALKERACLHTR